MCLDSAGLTGVSLGSHLEQLVLLALPQPQLLVQGDGHTLGLGPAALTHAQLRQLVTHGAVQRGEVLGDGALPARLLTASSPSGRRAPGLLNLGANTHAYKSSR